MSNYDINELASATDFDPSEIRDVLKSLGFQIAGDSVTGSILLEGGQEFDAFNLLATTKEQGLTLAQLAGFKPGKRNGKALSGNALATSNTSAPTKKGKRAQQVNALQQNQEELKDAAIEEAQQALGAGIGEGVTLANLKGLGRQIGLTGQDAKLKLGNAQVLREQSLGLTNWAVQQVVLDYAGTIAREDEEDLGELQERLGIGLTF